MRVYNTTYTVFDHYRSVYYYDIFTRAADRIFGWTGRGGVEGENRGEGLSIIVRCHCASSEWNPTDPAGPGPPSDIIIIIIVRINRHILYIGRYTPRGMKWTI